MANKPNPIVAFIVGILAIVFIIGFTAYYAWMWFLEGGWIYVLIFVILAIIGGIIYSKYLDKHSHNYY